MTEWNLVLYGVIKIAAYTAVCLGGLRYLGQRRDTVLLPAVGLGLLRVAMGLVFGVGIFFASAYLVAGSGGGTKGQVFAYLTVYVPTRWIEWSLIALLLTPGARSLGGFLFGSSRADRLWRASGIAVSCAADVPVLLAVGGLPVGRFMC